MPFPGVQSICRFFPTDDMFCRLGRLFLHQECKKESIMYEDMFDTDRIDKEVRRKVLTVVFLVLCGIIAFYVSATVEYERKQKELESRKPEPAYRLKGLDRSKDPMDVSEITPELEVIYNDDPRLRKYPITTAPESRYHESDVDFSDPDVVDQIMQTADFYDLYERYAD